jgi:hypothetical protein
MNHLRRLLLISGVVAATLALVAVFAYPPEPNRIEIDPDRLRERRSRVLLGVTISTEVTETWITPRLPATPDRWVTIYRSFFPRPVATRPELEPIEMIGRALDKMQATDEERSQFAAEIHAIVSRGMSDWHQTRNRLAYAALPPEKPPESIEQLRELLARTTP